MVQKRDDALPLDLVIFDHKQALQVRSDVRLDPVECILQIIRRCGFDQIRERTVRQPVLPFFLNREHLHRDMTRGRIQLQIVQHGPAQHVGQEHIQRNRRRMELPGQTECGLAAVGDNAFETFVAGHAQ